jgi:hypothetical protein
VDIVGVGSKAQACLIYCDAKSCILSFRIMLCEIWVGSDGLAGDRRWLTVVVTRYLKATSAKEAEEAKTSRWWVSTLEVHHLSW